MLLGHPLLPHLFDQQIDVHDLPRAMSAEPSKPRRVHIRHSVELTRYGPQLMIIANSVERAT